MFRVYIEIKKCNNIKIGVGVMKLENRKGSTLALTIMIFAVLMIFATFTLGFMVTENKQAMYHQNKTQAYYIARSGAEAVEESIKNDFNNIVPKISEDPDNPTNAVITYNGKDFEGNSKNKNANIILTKTETNKIEYNTPTSRVVTDYDVSIISQALINGVSEEVEKVLKVSITDDYQVSLTKPIVYFDPLGTTPHLTVEENPAKGKAEQGDPTLFKDFIFGNDESNASEVEFNSIETGSALIGSTLSGNYKIDNFNKQEVNYIFQGEVNIHVKDYLRIKNVSFTPQDSSSKLNIFIYGEDNAQSYILKNGSQQQLYDNLSLIIESDRDTVVNANFYIKEGDVFIFGSKLTLNGDILIDRYGEGDVYLVSLANSANLFLINGLIYNKYGSVNLGAAVGNSAISGAIRLYGLVVGDSVIHGEGEQHLDKLDFTLVAGINSYLPISVGSTTITLINDGYYK
jgi:hypothetical protein